MTMEDIPDGALAAIMLFFMLIPLVFAYFGVVVLCGALRVLKHGQWVMGTVVEVKEIYHFGKIGAQQYSYQPIFEFTAPDGARLRGGAGNYGNTNPYPVGSQRKVLVDFDNPDPVAMSSWFRLVFGAGLTVFGLVCVVFILFAVASVLGG